MPLTINLLLNAFKILLVREYLAYSVVSLVLYPYCSFLMILNLVQLFDDLVCIAFSKIFETAAQSDIGI